MTACQFCGNDDGVYSSCLDCLGSDPHDIAMALAIVLGGTSDDWHDIAHAMRGAM